jgi:hypothetical protein
MGKLAASVVILFIGSALSACSVIHQQIVAGTRRPGDHMVATPEQVSKEITCRTRDRPSAEVETMEVLPEVVPPGDRVNYRMVYTMCPLNRFSETLNARATRKIFHNGQEVARNIKDDFTLKAGRWAVDSFFTLPRETPLGVYALEVTLHIANRPIQTHVRSFVVSNEFYPAAGS